jgi:glycosyltransferase involved in cell wall biosynthesis
LSKKLKIAWIADFPVEWLPDLPEPLRALPRRHPATWEIVLLSELEKDPVLEIQVILLRRRIRRDFSFERNGTVFHILKVPRPAWRIGTFFWLDTSLIRRVCRKFQPDLVHAWGNENGAALIAHRLGYPYVTTVQGLFSWYKERVPLSGYLRFVELLERITLPRAPVVTTEATFAVQFLKERYPHLCVQQVEHAPNPAFWQVTRRPETKPIHFISNGTLDFRKGTDLLFKALDRLAGEMAFKLTVLSSCPDAQYLESLRSAVSEELWQRVEFKHHMLPDEVARELATATMLVSATRADTSPNAIKEAVVAGVPTIASHLGGIPDYVFPGKNGLLFPPGDLQELLHAIRSACAHPLFSRGLVDPNTLSQTRTYLSTERMAKSFLAAYQTALAASA